MKIAEDYAMLQHLAGGRVDLMMCRGNTGPVYPWFGKDAPVHPAVRPRHSVTQAAAEVVDRTTRRGDPPRRDPYAPVPSDTLLPGG